MSFFSLVLFIILMAYALIGQEFFSFRLYVDSNGNAVPPGTPGAVAMRENFDTSYAAFTSVFILFIADNWDGILVNYVNAVGNWAILYLVSIIIIGNFILINLFLAILVENFEQSDRDLPQETLVAGFNMAVLANKGKNKDDDAKKAKESESDSDQSEGLSVSSARSKEAENKNLNRSGEEG